MKAYAQIFSNSYTITIIKCCIAAVLLALAISMPGKVDVNEFVQNILDWESI
ncbi:MAG: hypothetical protein K0Q95_720 [Bacteroidota bacterium]|jgi:hypothetical protein|nr:hypothetical protein [Bacteroidota bacterium]